MFGNTTCIKNWMLRRRNRNSSTFFSKVNFETRKTTESWKQQQIEILLSTIVF